MNDPKPLNTTSDKRILYSPRPDMDATHPLQAEIGPTAP